MRRLVALLIAVFSVGVLAGRPAFAEKRVALVIGNSAYQNAPKLPNPANDAAAIVEMFRSAKFDVVEAKHDLNIVEMRRAFRDFSDKVRDADIAVVYYAGHGLEVDGTNYLIPTDAVLERDSDAFDEAIPLDRALQVIEPAKQLRLVILDACRDNPFARTMKRTMASRALGRGLAGVEPGKPNTLIAFAAKGGSTADDGAGVHSPFTAALLNRLVTPGVDLRKTLGQVRDDVMKATGDRQEPFVYGSLGGSDISLVPAAPAPSAGASGASGDPQDRIRRDYELALQLGTRDGWETFLQQYPSGFYAGLAKGQLNKIAAEEVRAAAVEKAKQAEAEKARLAAEQATAAAQAKAAADAKTAEQAKLAAEKLKQEQQAKAEAAERVRASVEQAAADKAAKAAEDAKKEAANKTEQKPTQVAALPPEASAAAKPASPDSKPTSADIARALQSELRRVGCFTGNVDGEWKAPSQRALDSFNKYSAMKLDVKLASLDAIDAVRSRTARVCPLICDQGFRADGERCVRITCKAGYEIGDDNSCVKVEKKPPVANKREQPAAETRADDQKAKAAANAGGGELFCTSYGCRHVRKGCHVEGGNMISLAHEVCP